MSYVNAPVHDLLIRIKNAYMARRTTVDGVVYSKFKANILDLEARIKVTILNDIPSVKFYSRPSRPWYVGYKDLKSVAGGKGLGIISTNQGLLPAHVAKQKKLGGELIAEIY